MPCKRFKWFAAMVVAVLVCGGSAAHAVPLSTLIGGTQNCGALSFSNFTYSATGDMPAAANVDVNCIGSGLSFQGAFDDSIGGGSSGALITYAVTVLIPGSSIVAAQIAGNPYVGGTSEIGNILVTDTFAPDALNTMSIFANSPGATQTTDSTNFASGFTTLHVQKNIVAQVENASTNLSLTFVNQTYALAASASVPEPGTLGLLSIGLLGLVGYGHRSRKRAPHRPRRSRVAAMAEDETRLGPSQRCN